MNSAMNPANVVELVFVRLERDCEAVDVDGELLCAAERERAARFRSEVERRRYIGAHAMLRRLLAARCGRPAGSLRLEAGVHGRPALVGDALQFSMSRSGELAAYAFARSRAVGVDVEAIRALPDADAIARRTFPRREWRDYAALAARDKQSGFFRGWTRTEALAKALGRGLAMAPEALDAALDGDWELHSFTPAAGFAGALACARLGVCA